MKNHRLFFGFAALFLAALFAFNACDNGSTDDDGDANFIAVTDITGVPAAATAGTPLTLTGTVTPADATNKTMVWSLKDGGTTGAVITGNALNATAAGTTVVTATIAKGASPSTPFTKDFSITVSAAAVPVSGVSLNKTTLTLTVGGMETLTATVAPDTATNKAVSWTSSNPSVASVNNDGTVTAVAAGTATITVSTAEGAKTAACTVTVNAKTGSGDVTITQPGAGEADPVLDSPEEPPNGYPSDFTIIAPSDYQSYQWLLDGRVQTGQTGNTFTVTVSGLSKGSHSVTVVVVKNGKNYSVIRNFKVSH
jgi:uncharacterized protein YjdB